MRVIPEGLAEHKMIILTVICIMGLNSSKSFISGCLVSIQRQWSGHESYGITRNTLRLAPASKHTKSLRPRPCCGITHIVAGATLEKCADVGCQQPYPHAIAFIWDWLTLQARRVLQWPHLTGLILFVRHDVPRRSEPFIWGYLVSILLRLGKSDHNSTDMVRFVTIQKKHFVEIGSS